MQVGIFIKFDKVSRKAAKEAAKTQSKILFAAWRLPLRLCVKLLSD
jgi:hypothetical protein